MDICIHQKDDVTAAPERDSDRNSTSKSDSKLVTLPDKDTISVSKQKDSIPTDKVEADTTQQLIQLILGQIVPSEMDSSSDEASTDKVENIDVHGEMSVGELNVKEETTYGTHLMSKLNSINSESQQFEVKCPKEGGSVVIANDINCGVCIFTSKSKIEVNRHIRIKHPESLEVGNIHCDLCNFKTKSKAHMTSHRKCEHELDPPTSFPCILCEYVSNTAGHLKRHCDLRHNENPTRYKCPPCGTTFSTHKKGSY